MRKFLFLVLLAFTFTQQGKAQANFAPDKTSGCPPLVVNFTDQTSFTPTSWTWDFGNGNTSTLQNPSATFLASGTFHIKLITSNGTQTDSVTKAITVFKLPIANFTADRPQACAHDTVHFFNTCTRGDAPIIDYAWDLGYTNSGRSGPNTQFIYNAVGNYNITLVVQDSNGCAANKTVAPYIFVHGSPTASFTASPQFSCNATQLINFTNTSTGAGTLSYAWDLADGVTSTLQNPSRTFTQEIKNIKLVATDSNGCKGGAIVQIKVEDIVADFKVTQQKACTGEKVQFTNISNFPGTAWYWDFGDGTNSTVVSPQKTYSAPGIYTVSLTVIDGACHDSITKTQYMTIINGFSVSKPTFSADSTVACGKPLNVTFTNTTPGTTGATFSWDFGNGDTSNLENPNTTFMGDGGFNVTLTITDTNGCSITGTVNKLIQTAKPVAKFKADTLVCLGAAVSFTNLSTNAQTFMWIFGDGDTAYTTTASHIYRNYGYYTVTLVAYNRGGCDTTTTRTDYIHITPMHVDFNVNNTFSPCPPFVCTMHNLSGPGLKYFWKFGDGTTDTATNPTHIYFYPGVYTVTMYGQSPQGCHDSVTYTNLITVQGPTATFAIAPTTGCIPLQVNFTATPSVNTLTEWCDLGDGTVLRDSLSFAHTYNSVRVFHPQFVLTDHVGCSVAYPLDSIVTHTPPALNVSDTAVCPGQKITLSFDPSCTYNWAPATHISCATCSTVTIDAADSTAYTVSSSNSFGCNVSAFFSINVEPFPVLTNIHDIHLCPNDSIQLSVSNATKVIWIPGTYLSDSTIANPICSPQAPITYAINAFNKLGCGISTTLPIIVKDKVDISLPASLSVCENATFGLATTLNYGSDLGVNYTWYENGHINDVHVANPTASIQNTTEHFTVIATSGHCIPDTESITVTVVPTPDIEVSATVQTTPYADVPLYAASHQELNYVWSSEDSFSCADCRRTEFFPSRSGIVYVTGTNKYGCSVKDSVMVEVQGCDGNSIFMPNTFTPNGDGINDKFYVRSTTLTTLKSFRIFDVWGNQVFETHNLNEGWDGTVHGKQDATAVYVYIVEGKCQNGYDVMKSGNVTAVR